MSHQMIPTTNFRTAAAWVSCIAIISLAGTHTASSQQAGEDAARSAGCRSGHSTIEATHALCVNGLGTAAERSTQPQRLVCPKEYEVLADVCFNASTGDVILGSRTDRSKS